ncbi:Secreted protein [Pseudomonas donghuensis]
MRAQGSFPGPFFYALLPHLQSLWEPALPAMKSARFQLLRVGRIAGNASSHGGDHRAYPPRQGRRAALASV